MNWAKIVRVAAGIVGVAGGVVGVATGNVALAAPAIALAGWALPWIRELQLDKAAGDVVKQLPDVSRDTPPPFPSQPRQALDDAVRRLKRITTPPKDK